jgi:hypothetical protein
MEMEIANQAREHQTCRRCYATEYIPTHQFVTFDCRIHYLCQRCWEDFRKWFHWGKRRAAAAKSPEF